jgi:predicted amidohydrolase YtcJ
MDFLEHFEAVDKVIPLADKRWVMGHLDRATEHQIERLAELNLAMTSHTNRYIYKYGHIVRDEIGVARENEIAPLRSIVEAGIPIGLATDNVPTTLWYPVWQTVARYNMFSDDQIGPDQALTREQALTCATRNGAYLTGEEDIKGTLEPGKLADLVILDKDPLSCPENDIKDITAEMTIVGGKVVHDTGTIPQGQS